MKPPGEDGDQSNLRREEREADQEDGDVSKEDNDDGEEVALAGDIRLAGLKDVPGQSEMKRVGGAEQQVEPRAVGVPAKEKMTEAKQEHDQEGVERKEIRRENDKAIASGYHDVPAA